MINANELRIGNWVIVKAIIDGLISIKKMRWMSDFDVKIPNHKFGEDKVNIDNIEPIPLTPEILEKCGGQWNHKCWHTVNKLNQCNFLICPSKEEGFWLLSYSSDYAIIQSLHQLQNLYFALTGEELTVQL